MKNIAFMISRQSREVEGVKVVNADLLYFYFRVLVFPKHKVTN